MPNAPPPPPLAKKSVAHAQTCEQKNNLLNCSKLDLIGKHTLSASALCQGLFTLGDLDFFRGLSEIVPKSAKMDRFYTIFRKLNHALAHKPPTPSIRIDNILY